MTECRCPKCGVVLSVTAGEQPTPPPKVAPSGPTEKTLKIEAEFPPDLQELLVFRQEGDTCIVKGRTFLCGDAFPRTAEIVKALGGKYVSALQCGRGRSSHFEIPISDKEKGKN